MTSPYQVSHKHPLSGLCVWFYVHVDECNVGQAVVWGTGDTNQLVEALFIQVQAGASFGQRISPFTQDKANLFDT